MLRYSYWLRNRQHASRRIVGGWTEADMAAEIDLWRSAGARRLDSRGVVAELLRRFQTEYDEAIDDALERTTDPMLASCGLPIWNLHIEALVPGALDQLRIYETIDNESSALGQTYKYGLNDEPVRASLYFYPDEYIGIAAGIGDPKLKNEFVQAAGEMATMVSIRGGELVSVQGPVAEHLEGADGVIETVVTHLFCNVGPDGSRKSEYLSMAGFRGRYFKMRVTMPVEGPEGRSEWFSADRFNYDLASFLAYYGP